MSFLGKSKIFCSVKITDRWKKTSFPVLIEMVNCGNSLLETFICSDNLKGCQNNIPCEGCFSTMFQKLKS